MRRDRGQYNTPEVNAMFTEIFGTVPVGGPGDDYTVWLKNSGHFWTLCRPETTNAMQVRCVPANVAESEVLRRANLTIISPGITHVTYGSLGLRRVVSSGPSSCQS